MASGITLEAAQAAWKQMTEGVGGTYRQEEANDAYNVWKAASDALGNNGVGSWTFAEGMADFQQRYRIRFQRPTASGGGVGGTADPFQTATPTAPIVLAPLPALVQPAVTTVATPTAGEAGHVAAYGPAAISGGYAGGPVGPAPAGLAMTQPTFLSTLNPGGASLTTWLLLGGVAAAALYLVMRRRR